MRQFTQGQRFRLPNGETVEVQIVLRPRSDQTAFETMDRVTALVEVRLVPADLASPLSDVYDTVARNGEIVHFSETKCALLAIDVDDLEEVTT